MGAPDPKGRGLAQTVKWYHSYLMPHNVQYTITFIFAHNIWKGIPTEIKQQQRKKKVNIQIITVYTGSAETTN
jgi:hypothetical protein